ncbi:hypothetical protein AWB81_03132 [Caballeronia arationis]|jgi:hypothetical protein|uniref:Uncharacterized protein n=1 Tax=Caballeronia arationis TaxID=1777142 RepID=A0A7Z7N5J8_9BURK|nr:hypothetical protein AWB81_03132 [Caballeronia arationis]SOE82212.1 hypothetical protein SAMN05446927_5527 [Caballeronia arationis]
MSVKFLLVRTIHVFLLLASAYTRCEASLALSPLSARESEAVANWVDTAYRSIAIDNLSIYLEKRQTFIFRTWVLDTF